MVLHIYLLNIYFNSKLTYHEVSIQYHKMFKTFFEHLKFIVLLPLTTYHFFIADQAEEQPTHAQKEKATRQSPAVEDPPLGSVYCSWEWWGPVW